MRITALLLFILVAACFSEIAFTQNFQNDQTSFSFAILSDIHIGDAAGQYVVDLAAAAVSKINSLALKYDIQFVFITGDLSNSAQPWQYQQVRQILDNLTVPYFPILGNHDVWNYNSTWEEETPTGDAMFAHTFADRLSQVDFYNNQTVWNPDEEIYSWFQNWELRVGKMVFIALDWNSRHRAATELGYKGCMPTAELHDFEGSFFVVSGPLKYLLNAGGTLPFLDERLSKIPTDTKTIAFLQHHPYRVPFPLPDFIYSFSHEKKLIIRELLHEKHSELNDKYWGTFAGHFHIWYNGTAFDEWPEFWLWETEASKETGAISLVHVEDEKITGIEIMYGPNNWKPVYDKAAAAAARNHIEY